MQGPMQEVEPGLSDSPDRRVQSIKEAAAAAPEEVDDAREVLAGPCAPVEHEVVAGREHMCVPTQDRLHGITDTILKIAQREMDFPYGGGERAPDRVIAVAKKVRVLAERFQDHDG